MADYTLDIEAQEVSLSAGSVPLLKEHILPGETTSLTLTLDDGVLLYYSNAKELRVTKRSMHMYPGFVALQSTRIFSAEGSDLTLTPGDLGLLYGWTLVAEGTDLTLASGEIPLAYLEAFLLVNEGVELQLVGGETSFTYTERFLPSYLPVLHILTQRGTDGWAKLNLTVKTGDTLWLL
jgi:hypothetical protein